MISNDPSEFAPDLTEERLHDICERVLDVVQSSLEDASTEYDTEWTKGCLPYGRVQGLFKRLHTDKSIPWITLANGTMDFTPKIGNTLIQFVVDDYLCPKKAHRLKANSVENMQLNLALQEDIEIQAVTWRLFVSIKRDDEFPELKATLVGYDLNSNPICTWQHEDIAAVPMAVEKAKVVPIEDAKLSRKNTDEDKDDIDETE